MLLHAFYGLQAADFASTAGVVLSGKGHEANPLISWAFDINPLVGLTFLGAEKIGVSYGVTKMNKQKPKCMKPVLAAANIVLSAVVFHNFWILFK